MDPNQNLLKCMLARNREERGKLGCDDNVFDSIPTKRKGQPLGITSQCKDHFINEHHPWQKQDKGCDTQFVNYLKNTDGNLNMKRAVCGLTPLDVICGTPVLTKMCFGKWERANAKECKDIDI